MSRAILLVLVAALAQSSRASAAGPPSWARRAMRSVVRVIVPERADTRVPDKQIPAQTGGGFFVGSSDQIVYLVTAAHVIWSDFPSAREIVSLSIQLQLPECHAIVPALADSAQASSRKQLDLAVVTIKIADMPNEVRNRCQDVANHLPRQIIAPDADELEKTSRAWLIGPGSTIEAIDSSSISFLSYENDQLHFKEPAFTEGDSGSPIFSESGHIVGMAVKMEGGTAMRFSRILAKLDKDWVIPTNLAGRFSMLSFRDRLGGARLSVDGAPDVVLDLHHPAPLGDKVELRLRLADRQEVTGVVDIKEGTNMECNVKMSLWLARHREAEVYTTLSLVAATGLVFAAGRVTQSSFEQSPSKASYDHVRLFNGISVGTGLAAVTSLSATVIGYLSSDSNRLTCQARRP